MDIKLLLKYKPSILYGLFKVIFENGDDLESIISNVKRFSDDIAMQFSLDNAKFTFIKGLLVILKTSL